MPLLDARNQALGWRKALPGAGAGGRGCRGRRAAPRKKMQKNLTSPCKAVTFPRKLRIVFQARGGNAGRKKGLKTRSPVAQSRNLAYIRYGSLGADKPGAQRLTLDKHEKTCKFFRIKA